MYVRVRHYRYWLMSILLLALIIIGGAYDLQRPMQPSSLRVSDVSSSVAAPLPVVAVPVVETGHIFASSAANVLFSDVTEFNESDSKARAGLDALKQRYEAWLVTYYILIKCKKIDVQDINHIREALRYELRDVQPHDNIEENIKRAANGSYQEMYSNTPCDDARLISTKTAYDANMQQTHPAKAVENSASGAHY